MQQGRGHNLTMQKLDAGACDASCSDRPTLVILCLPKGASAVFENGFLWPKRSRMKISRARPAVGHWAPSPKGTRVAGRNLRIRFSADTHAEFHVVQLCAVVQKQT